jgi:hypothetical protein
MQLDATLRYRSLAGLAQSGELLPFLRVSIGVRSLNEEDRRPRHVRARKVDASVEIGGRLRAGNPGI